MASQTPQYDYLQLKQVNGEVMTSLYAELGKKKEEVH